MNAVLDKDVHVKEEYVEADFDEVMRISDRIIEQHKEAYRVLADA